MATCCNPNQRIQDELDDLYDKISKLALSALPEVSELDNGKFLRVVEGVWAKAAVPYAEDSKF